MTQSDKLRAERPKVEYVVVIGQPKGMEIANIDTKGVKKLDDFIDKLLTVIGEQENFKTYVHTRLDEAGIERAPNGEHSKAGCRIGDRLDLVFEEIQQLKRQLGEEREKIESLLNLIEREKNGNHLQLKALIMTIEQHLTQKEEK